MKQEFVCMLVVVFCLSISPVVFAQAAGAEDEEVQPAPNAQVEGEAEDDESYPTPIKCTMKFSMKSWSIIYKSGKGEGVITCDNGQSQRVKLKSKGGGLTAGKGEIRKGKGSFSEVYDISDLYGSYAVAEASAGAGKSAGAQLVTKGETSLALSGVGAGVELGFSFGKFTIKPKN